MLIFEPQNVMDNGNNRQIFVKISRSNNLQYCQLANMKEKQNYDFRNFKEPPFFKATQRHI